LKELERFLVNFISLAKTREEADLRADAAITWLGGRYVGKNGPKPDDGHEYDLYQLNMGYVFPMPFFRLKRIFYIGRNFPVSEINNKYEKMIATFSQEPPYYNEAYIRESCRYFTSDK
jgi:hypothetical protein